MNTGFKNIVYKLLVLLIIACITSCATIINQKTTELSVFTNPDSAFVSIGVNSDTCFQTPVQLKVPRASKDLLLTFMHDSIEKLIQVESRFSPAFTIGNCFNGAGIIGYIIDLTNDKKYTYGRTIYIDLYETGNNYLRWHPSNEKAINISCSLAECNFFHIDINKIQHKNFFGFIGLTGGLEYYYMKRKFVSAQTGFVMNYPIPFPIDLYGPDDEFENVSSWFIQLQHHNRIGRRFQAGYGLQFTDSYYSYHGDNPNQQSDNQHHFSAIGFSSNASIRLFPKIFFRVSYLPSILKITEQKVQLDYNHILFFDVMLKFQLYKPLSQTAPFRRGMLCDRAVKH